jgi:hypothetical protein
MVKTILISKWFVRIGGALLALILAMCLTAPRISHASSITFIQSTIGNAPRIDPADDVDSGPDESCTLRDALEMIQTGVVDDVYLGCEAQTLGGEPSGDYVIYLPNEYVYTLDPERGQLVVDGGELANTIEIRGNEFESVIVQGSPVDPGNYNEPAPPGAAKTRVFYVMGGSTVTMTGFTIQHGYVQARVDDVRASSGGGLFLAAGSDVTLDAMALKNNRAWDGGGAFLDAGRTQLTITNGSLIEGNTAYRTGGVYSDIRTKLDVSGSVFQHNLAEDAGAISLTTLSRASLSDGSVIQMNYGRAEAGGILNRNGQLYVQSTTFANNATEGLGGAILSSLPEDARFNPYLVVRNSIFGENAADRDGGAIYVRGDNKTEVTIDGTIYPSPSVNKGCISGNSHTAVVTEEPFRLEAENNWWGASDGPSGAGPGSGDSVSRGVNYRGYLLYIPEQCLSATFDPFPDPIYPPLEPQW